MFCRNILFIIIIVFLSNCTTTTLLNNKPSIANINGYSNKGFALVYSDELYKKKLVNKKIDERSLVIFQKNLKVNTPVKITNILNNKSLIASVGKNSNYPSFNNTVISLRIAEELELDIDQPYVEILEILDNSIFVAQKAKTFEEEKNVAIKAPVNNISISDLSLVKKDDEKNHNRNFSYTIKIADFYFKDTALMMINRIKNEILIKNPKIKKISDKNYRVYLGPFNNIISLQKSFNDISILQFENIEILKND
ncbi:hypothetical protein N9C92_01435 [Candidatus Pelagibacter sp.]|jgi:choline kinase|nr:hypothetical protein [Candidatus Pelagibacter sp.]